MCSPDISSSISLEPRLRDNLFPYARINFVCELSSGVLFHYIFTFSRDPSKWVG